MTRRTSKHKRNNDDNERKGIEEKEQEGEDDCDDKYTHIKTFSYVPILAKVGSQSS